MNINDPLREIQFLRERRNELEIDTILYLEIDQNY